jgi:hypothetical protein
MIAVFVWALDEAGTPAARIDGFQNKIERSKGERWRTRGVVTPAAWITTMIKHTDCCANKTRRCNEPGGRVGDRNPE